MIGRRSLLLAGLAAPLVGTAPPREQIAFRVVCERQVSSRHGLSPWRWNGQAKAVLPTP